MCTDHVTDGTMGQHYVNLDLVLDTATGVPTIDPLQPEALVYEPKINGGYRLVGVEYVVFQDAWDAANDAPPALFGKTFTLIPAGNRYDLPPFYELPRLDLAPQPERNLQGLEPERLLPRPGRPGLDPLPGSASPPLDQSGGGDVAPHEARLRRRHLSTRQGTNPRT